MSWYSLHCHVSTQRETSSLDPTFPSVVPTSLLFQWQFPERDVSTAQCFKNTGLHILSYPARLTDPLTHKNAIKT